MSSKLAQTIQELSFFFNPPNYAEEEQKILWAISLALNFGVLETCQISKGKKTREGVSFLINSKCDLGTSELLHLPR